MVHTVASSTRIPDGLEAMGGTFADSRDRGLFARVTLNLIIVLDFLSPPPSLKRLFVHVSLQAIRKADNTMRPAMRTP